MIVAYGWADVSALLSAAALDRARGWGSRRVLPWGLLVAGSAASLAANGAVAEPTLVGRVIAAQPSFAFSDAYEMLMR